MSVQIAALFTIPENVAGYKLKECVHYGRVDV